MMRIFQYLRVSLATNANKRKAQKKLLFIVDTNYSKLS